MRINLVKAILKSVGFVQNKLRQLSTLILSLFISSSMAFAETVETPYSWDEPIKKIADDMSSNVVLGIAIIAIAGCGCLIAFTDLQSGGKRGVTVAIGLSIALGATSILSKLFGHGALIF
jgi:type IV secretory pathway VirB2 component (pilin)